MQVCYPINCVEKNRDAINRGNSMGDFIVNVILAVLIVIAMLLLLQFSLNLYYGVY